ncbi:MAG: hypothetical protein JSW36_16985 [Burkholderiales bacterium]|nr:MAG: hypothetical protein JSW36_16985 [Burkholderiales bacterium]
MRRKRSAQFLVIATQARIASRPYTAAFCGVAGIGPMTKYPGSRRHGSAISPHGSLNPLTSLLFEQQHHLALNRAAFLA